MDVEEREELAEVIVEDDINHFSEKTIRKELKGYMIQSLLSDVGEDEDMLIELWEETTSKRYSDGEPILHSEWENNGFANEADFWKYKEGR